MNPFSLLIKPASADCNLRCEYCFYLDRCELYPETKRHRMPDDVLERMVSSYLATQQPQYAFGWQGGEPTLMGLDFFRKAVKLQQKHGRPGAVVANGLQTNATLIDDDFAEFFARYNFLLGVSVDGPAEIHDRHRLTAGGKGSHEAVMRGIDCLKRHNVAFNALVLVNSANVHRAREVYRYVCDLGIMFHQYIPCVEFDGDGRPLPFSISGEEWGEFLCELYDAWLPHDTRRVSNRLFDSILTLLVEGRHNICHMGRNCCQYFVVEHNGDIYPCDFFVEKDLKIGNVMTHSWEDCLQEPVYLEFGRQKAQWNEECARCEVLEFCAGDCLKHRLPVTRDPRTLSWLCAGWKRFYAHALPGFRRLADEVSAQRERQRRQAAAMSRSRQMTQQRVGRNDPCPCGSGKKYKSCCGK